jgi:hypothetical protein
VHVDDRERWLWGTRVGERGAELGRPDADSPLRYFARQVGDGDGNLGRLEPRQSRGDEFDFLPAGTRARHSPGSFDDVV